MQCSSKLMIATRFTIVWLALLSVVASASVEAFAAPAKPAPQHANGRLPFPPVPDLIQITDGSVPFLVGHGDGTQNYVCKATANGGFAFALFTPQATLFNEDL